MRSDQVWTLVFELALAAFLMWVDTRLFFLYFFAGVVWQTVRTLIELKLPTSSG